MVVESISSLHLRLLPAVAITIRQVMPVCRPMCGVSSADVRRCLVVRDLRVLELQNTLAQSISGKHMQGPAASVLIKHIKLQTGHADPQFAQTQQAKPHQV